MKCILCGHEEIKDSHTTVVREFGKMLLIIRYVPCCECEFCGEVMLNDDVAEKVSEIVSREKERLESEINVVDYTTVA